MPGHAPSTEIGAPHSASAIGQPRAEVAAPDEERRTEGADDPTDPERSRERGHAAVAGVEDVEGEHDDEHVHGAAHGALREAESEHEPQVALVGHRADPLDELASEVGPHRCVPGGSWAVRGARAGARRWPATTAAMASVVVDGLVAVSSAPARIGPTSSPAASTTPRTTFALVSSSVSAHRAGRSAEWTGRNAAIAIVATTARPYTVASGASDASSSPQAPIAAARHGDHHGEHADPVGAVGVRGDEGGPDRGRQHPQESDEADAGGTA